MSKNPRSRFPLPAVTNPSQRRCVTLNIPDEIGHIGNFWGAINKLASTGSYENDPDKRAIAIAAVWREVFEEAYEGWINQECGGIPEEGECIEYEPCIGLITYEPGNPCTNPDFVPDGYLVPPFFVVTNEAIPISFGAAPGDVWTDLTRLPVQQWPIPTPGQGFPRFRFKFNVPIVQDITVELHFVKIPSHGFVFVSQDNAALPLPEFFNLNRDLSSTPPETALEVVLERHFLAATVGEHWVDVTVLPWFDIALDLPLHFGMCFRKIVLCGKDLEVPVPELQFDDCTIRFRPTSASAWQEYDITACVNERVEEIIREKIRKGEIGGGQEGPGGSGPNPAQCFEYDVTLRADSRWIAPIPIKANYEITITEASGGASGGTPSWYCPSGAGYVLGECNEAFAHTDPGDPMPAQNHMRLIMNYNATNYDAYNVVHPVSPGLSGSHDLTFQVNDGTINDNSGSYSFHLKICNQPTVNLHYDSVAGQQVDITQLSTHKWHVNVFGTTPGLPFAPYAVTLYYGPPPSPSYEICARWEFSNLVGWSGETDPQHLDAKAYRRLCNNTIEFSPDQQPLTDWCDGLCLNECFGRSATAYSFDVELFFDCP